MRPASKSGSCSSTFAFPGRGNAAGKAFFVSRIRESCLFAEVESNIDEGSIRPSRSSSDFDSACAPGVDWGDEEDGEMLCVSPSEVKVSEDIEVAEDEVA